MGDELKLIYVIEFYGVEDYNDPYNLGNEEDIILVTTDRSKAMEKFDEIVAGHGWRDREYEHFQLVVTAYIDGVEIHEMSITEHPMHGKVIANAEAGRNGVWKPEAVCP